MYHETPESRPAFRNLKAMSEQGHGHSGACKSRRKRFGQRIYPAQYTSSPSTCGNPASQTPETHRITRRRVQKRLKRQRGALPNRNPTSPRPPGPKPTGTEPQQTAGAVSRSWAAIRPPCGRDARPCMSWGPVGFDRPPPRSRALATSAGGETSGPSLMGDVHACGW